jgi:transglutaminase-like putative cysteine protease
MATIVRFVRSAGQLGAMASILLAALPTQADEAAIHSSTFRVRHELSVQVPKNAKQVRIWFTLPQEGADQRISDFKLDAPAGWRKVKDSQNNEYAYLEVANPKPERIPMVCTFDLVRSEVRSKVDATKSRALTDAELRELADYLRPNKHVVINDAVRKLSAEIVGTEKNPVIAARKIYNWLLNNVEYWVKDPKRLKASAEGSTEYCLSTHTGNCTDFHSLFASLARSAGIPTQIVYGSLFKPDLDGQDVDQNYHCWIEFYAPGFGWVPLDVSLANIYKGKIELDDTNRTLVRRTTATGYDGPDPKAVEYYFGNLEPRRVTWSRGRDLQLQPPPATGPVNAMTKAYIEVDGKELPASQWSRKLTFREIKK